MVETIMKAIKAMRIRFNFGDSWTSPYLHILLSQENEVIVARCLDFTVSSHGNNESDALNSLTEAVKECIISAAENDALDSIYDPSHSKYWRMFNELEAKQVNARLTKSLRKSIPSIIADKSAVLSSEVSHA